ncbi:hypothetical protein [Spirillospora sp. CA-294931]|uniref:hypothetical protein n=1 Tax=Spirillospora sp. CA-294931 TaxID=3240042 RepID=UPI003D92322D
MINMMSKSWPTWAPACPGTSGYAGPSAVSPLSHALGGDPARIDGLRLMIAERNAGSGLFGAFGIQTRDLLEEQRVQAKAHVDVDTRNPGGASGPYPWRRPV